MPLGEPSPDNATRTIAVTVAVDGLDAPLDGVLGGVEDSGRNGGPLDRADARRNSRRGAFDRYRRPRPARSRPGGRMAPAVSKTMPTSSARSVHFSTSSTMRGSPCWTWAPSAATCGLSTSATSESKVSSVKKSSAPAVRIAISASSSARVERRDPVSLTRRPPPPEPMPEGQPSQRVQRSRKHIDAGQVDGVRFIGWRLIDAWTRPHGARPRRAPATASPPWPGR